MSGDVWKDKLVMENAWVYAAIEVFMNRDLDMREICGMEAKVHCEGGFEGERDANGEVSKDDERTGMLTENL